jgi:ATP citrate (pro-S)-lyase
MARVKLSEYDAKRLLLKSLKNTFSGLAATKYTTSQELLHHFGETNLVVKVDQGIKKRGKQGLVKINVTPSEAVAAVKSWAKLGWSHFLVENVIEHSQSAEEYLALERTREGWSTSYSKKGGVEVESSWDEVKSNVPTQIQAILEQTLIPTLEKYHIVFLEMNPVLFRSGKLIPLDIAVEIDDAAINLPELASLSLSAVEGIAQADVEKQVAVLDEATPASLKFRLINPDGAIWMLLSGGGASLVLADEVNDQGMGRELANYGEYSGAPSEDDVYAYTKLIITSLLKSSAKKKVLVIAGGVANFTDVAKTFKGIIRALTESQTLLKKAKTKVFVRRGGPNEQQGLSAMEDFLKSAELLGSVNGHETPLTNCIKEVKEYL